MTRSRILLLMLLDLALIGGAGYRAYERYGELKPASAAAPVAPPAAPPAETPAVETSTAPVAVPAVEISTTTSDATATSTATAVSAPPTSTPGGVEASTGPAPTARVAFRYRNSVAKKVFLTGTFNNWTPAAFRKSASGLWTLAVDVVPGDHAYNFLVDGKTVRDPNQRRSDEKGRSLLRVAPASK
ncbi:MAG: glycogen-binding domain-containing protein [Elusimicrobia bacterium]|nr:glycogen-binding domain-containing protein [Elusimicrobiota bacterium]